MPTVSNTLLNDASEPLTGVRVEVYLLAPDLNGPAFSDNAQILSKVVTSTNNSGVWSLDLISNSLITPANTAYRVVHFIIGQRNSELTFIVPDGAGPFSLHDILAAAPGDLPTEASLIAFDPTDVGMEATNVQAAIEEVFTGVGGEGHGSTVLTARVDIADGLNTLFSVGAEVLPSPGANRINVVLSAAVESIAGPSGWGESCQLVLLYGPAPYSASGLGNIAAEGVFTVFGTGALDQFQTLIAIGASNRATMTNAPITLAMGSPGNDVTFDGTISVYLTYWIAELST